MCGTELWRSEDMKTKNNVENRSEISRLAQRLNKDKLVDIERQRLLAEERNDDEQTIINISPDIFEMLQDEYFKLRETGYDSSFNDFLRSKVRVTKANGGLLSNYKIESRKP